MKERMEINAADLDNIVGGAITWKPSGECYDKNHPETVYHFNVNDFENIQIYIRDHNGGRAQDINTLEMLKNAGYVW